MSLVDIPDLDSTDPIRLEAAGRHLLTVADQALRRADEIRRLRERQDRERERRSRRKKIQRRALALLDHGLGFDEIRARLVAEHPEELVDAVLSHRRVLRGLALADRNRRIARLALDGGLTDQALAERFGLTPATVNRIVNHARRIRAGDAAVGRPRDDAAQRA